MASQALYNRIPKQLKMAQNSVRRKVRALRSAEISAYRKIGRAERALENSIAKVRYIESNIPWMRGNPENPITIPFTDTKIYALGAPAEMKYVNNRLNANKRAMERLNSQIVTLQNRIQAAGNRGDQGSVDRLYEALSNTERRLEAVEQEYDNLKYNWDTEKWSNPMENPWGLPLIHKIVVPRNIRYLEDQINDRNRIIDRLRGQLGILQSKQLVSKDQSHADRLAFQMEAVEKRLEENEKEVTDLKESKNALEDQLKIWGSTKLGVFRRDIFSNPAGGDDMMDQGVDWNTLKNVRPVPDKEDFLVIPDADGSPPDWQRVQAQLPSADVTSRGRLINYNPSSWMSFLAAYRKRHPKPRSRAEGAALMKAAAREYHASGRNPQDIRTLRALKQDIQEFDLPYVDISPKPEFFGLGGNTAVVFIGASAIGLLKAWMWWKERSGV